MAADYSYRPHNPAGRPAARSLSRGCRSGRQRDRRPRLSPLLAPHCRQWLQSPRLQPFRWLFPRVHAAALGSSRSSRLALTPERRQRTFYKSLFPPSFCCFNCRPAQITGYRGFGLHSRPETAVARPIPSHDLLHVNCSNPLVNARTPSWQYSENGSLSSFGASRMGLRDKQERLLAPEHFGATDDHKKLKILDGNHERER